MTPCKCGCGKLTALPSGYVRPHWLKPRYEPRSVQVDGVECRALDLVGGHTVLFDAADEPLVLRYSWSVSHGYPQTTIPGSRKIVRLSRLILDEQDASVFVDHINCNKLDNRRANLRRATRSENMWNRRPNRRGASLLKGVSRSGTGSRWIAQIRAHGEHYYLGTFETEEAAHAAYANAAKQLHGEFVRTAEPEYWLTRNEEMRNAA
jgi:hypothetical protein